MSNGSESDAIDPTLRVEVFGAESIDAEALTPVPKPDPLLGTVLAGRYQILDVIASGGMGTVYRAKQKSLGRICAVKTIHASADPDVSRDFHRRFFLEASIASKLKHPNSVTIFDHGNEGDLYFMAMEYLDGETLRTVIDREGCLPVGRAITIAMEVARSVMEAHGLGVVHRDIKPANVMILTRDDTDFVKVLDFGLVKIVSGPSADTLTTGGVCIGSPSYMAPEQIDGDGVSPATDVYSLGILLYEMLCGRPPFVSASKYALVMAQLSELSPPLSEFMPKSEIPAGLEDVLDRCLEKDPLARFSTMSELLEELKLITQGQMPVSSSIPRSGRSTFRIRDGVVSVKDCGAGEAHGSASSTAASLLNVGSGPVAEAPRSNVAAFIGVGAALLVLISVGVGHHLARSSDDLASTMPQNADSAHAVVAGSVPRVSSSASPVPSTRSVRITTDPSGAEVQQSGRTLCAKTPCAIVLENHESGARELKVSLRGYLSKTVTVSDAEESVSVVLNPVSKPRFIPTKKVVTEFRESPY